MGSVYMYGLYSVSQGWTRGLWESYCSTGLLMGIQCTDWYKCRGVCLGELTVKRLLGTVLGEVLIWGPHVDMGMPMSYVVAYLPHTTNHT